MTKTRSEINFDSIKSRETGTTNNGGMSSRGAPID